MTRTGVLGVLGGTFDPIHNGHLEIAETVRHHLGLGGVLLLPCATPPHKSAGEISPAIDREAMLRLALSGREGLTVSTLELVADEVGYTIDTLRLMRRGPHAVEPVFILGMDSLIEIPTWRLFEDLMQEFDIAVFDRPGQELAHSSPLLHPAVRSRLWSAAPHGRANTIPPRLGRGGRIVHVPLLPIAISSSEIRARTRLGQGLDGLVPTLVARYIQRNQLYQREDRS